MSFNKLEGCTIKAYSKNKNSSKTRFFLDNSEMYPVGNLISWNVDFPESVGQFIEMNMETWIKSAMIL